MDDYYQVLGVERTASPEEIKRAYRKLAFLHHPDVGGTTEKFQAIGEAYSVLKDEVKRRNYDEVGHENFRDENHSEAPPTFEEMLKQWFDKNVGTETSVDEFARGFPSFYMGSDEWSDPETGDTPWSAQDIRIMKWERAAILLDEQVSYLERHLGDLVDSSYTKLLSPQAILRLAFGLYRDKFHINQDLYARVIDLVDEYTVEREQFMKQRDLQENNFNRMLPYLDLEKELNTKPFTKEERDRAEALYYKRNGSGNYLKNLDKTKNNGEVKAVKEAEGRRAAVWKENDKRREWRREVGKFR